MCRLIGFLNHGVGMPHGDKGRAVWPASEAVIILIESQESISRQQPVLSDANFQVQSHCLSALLNMYVLENRKW